MNIKVSQNIPFNNYNSKYYNTSFTKKDGISDSFQASTKPQAQQVSFKGNFFKTLFHKTPDIKAHFEQNEIPKEFAADISKGIKKVMGCNIPAKNFNNVMTPDELRQILPQLKEENFVCSKKNQNSGVYSIDLDYQTSFSSGVENVFDILDNVSQYADSYYAKTGKDFVFALTDRDSLEGLQHALRIIGSNPEQFKHVKLIPGIKMSFAHKAPTSNIGYENSDMLIYGINPFSDNIVDFVETTIKKRKEMTVNFIKKVNSLYPEFSYSVIEFSKQNNLKYKKGYGVANLYWRAREYAETKGDTEIKSIEMVPKDIIAQANEILDELDQVYLGSDNDGYSALGSEIIKNEDVNKSIKEVFDEYSTHYDERKGRVVSAAENLYDDMINCLSKEKDKPVLALASPYYFSHYYEGKNAETFDNVVRFIKDLCDDSNGMLMAFESIAPSYDLDSSLTPDKIKKFNNYMRENLDLYEVGGSFAKVKMQ